MPIRKELRYFNPIDWPQLSAWVRFVRAKGCCEACGRPHGKIVHHLGDGRWFDEAHETWRDGRGREVNWPAYGEYRISSRPELCSPPLTSTMTRATRGRQLARALPTLPYMIHDLPEHRRRRQITWRAVTSRLVV